MPTALGLPLSPTAYDDGTWTVYYPADEALGYAYRVHLSGALVAAETTVQTIVLCRCLPRPPASTPEGEPRLYVYDPWVEISGRSSVDQLRGASREFKDFALGIEDPDAGACGADGNAAVSVARYRTDGWATGVVGSCSGYVAIWGKADGRWREVWGGQEMPLCSDMRQYDVPQDIYQECWDGPP